MAQGVCIGVAMSYHKIEAKLEAPNFGNLNSKKGVIERQALPDELAGQLWMEPGAAPIYARAMREAGLILTRRPAS